MIKDSKVAGKQFQLLWSCFMRKRKTKNFAWKRDRAKWKQVIGAGCAWISALG